MRDCSNVEMRERLPELMHGVLRADVAADVRAHVAQCADCRAELELLERVRTVLAAPRVDTSHIVAHLPRYQRPSLWTRAARSPQLRAAAAVILVVGGWLAIGDGRDTAVVPDTTVAVATTPKSASTPASSATTAARGAAELAIGDTFQDLTDSDLAAMLDEIAKLEAVTPDATDDELPSVTLPGARSGSGSGA
jgi:hypothetical protein